MEPLKNYTVFDELTEEEKAKIVEDFLNGKLRVEFDEDHSSMILISKK